MSLIDAALHGILAQSDEDRCLSTPKSCHTTRGTMLLPGTADEMRRINAAYRALNITSTEHKFNLYLDARPQTAPEFRGT